MSKDNDDPMSPGNNKEGKVYIFQGSALQTWQFMGDSHLCLSEINIEEYLRRQFIENVWVIRVELCLWWWFYPNVTIF